MEEDFVRWNGSIFVFLMNYETRDVLKTYSGKHMYTNDETLKQRCFQVKMIDFVIDV